MHLFLVAAIGALCISEAFAVPDPHKYSSPDLGHIEVDVAIIGGGSGGINTAIRIKDAGASVLVIEKKSQIGGHAETYVNPTTGVITNLGVVFFENKDIVKQYFKRLGVPLVTVKVDPADSATYDFKRRIRVPAPTQEESAARQQAIAEAAQRYSENVLTKYPWLDSGYFLPEPVPEELTIPYSEFAAKYNFTALLDPFWRFNWYTGNLTTLPALYGLKRLGPGLLQSISGDFLLSGTGDTRSLYDAALKDLGSNANGVSILIRQYGQAPQLVRAKKLVIAIPPALENVGSYGLSGNEKKLFSKFNALAYIAGVGNVPGFNGTHSNIGIGTPFNQPIIPAANSLGTTGSPGEFLFGVGFDTDAVKTQDGKDVLRSNLESLAALGVVPPNAAESVTFPAIVNHRPFNLHVSGKEIKAGFYRKLLNLQGQQNTYWTGAAWAGHNSRLIWSFNEAFLLPRLKKDLGLH